MVGCLYAACRSSWLHALLLGKQCNWLGQAGKARVDVACTEVNALLPERNLQRCNLRHAVNEWLHDHGPGALQAAAQGPGANSFWLASSGSALWLPSHKPSAFLVCLQRQLKENR